MKSWLGVDAVFSIDSQCDRIKQSCQEKKIRRSSVIKGLNVSEKFKTAVDPGAV